MTLVMMSKSEMWAAAYSRIHICECGCGKTIDVLPSHKYKGVPKMLKGHMRRTTHTKIRDFISRESGKHFCQCGCGGVIQIAIQHHSNGIPRFITHHNAKIHNGMRGKFGSKNPRYRGGRTTDRNGYIKLLIGNVDGRAVYELEHRLVMQGIIGRPLLKTETVHHKNGIRSDNRPENLELWNSGHPGGQRVSDLVAFARQIIELYGDVDAKG